jgi:hypothetical protein
MTNTNIIQTRETVYLDFAKAALVAIMLTMAALVTGCGAPLEPEEHFAELGDAGELQLGTAEQAATYYMALDFGSVNGTGGDRCNHRPGQRNYSRSNPCVTPSRRNLKYNFGDTPGISNADYQNMRAGVLGMKEIANNLGWSLQQSTNGDYFSIRAVCNEHQLPTMGHTEYDYTRTIFDGSFARVQGGRVRVDVCACETVANNTYILGQISASQIPAMKAACIYNVAAHEFAAHVLGLGHGPSGECNPTSNYRPEIACFRQPLTTLPQAERDALAIFNVDP